MFNYNSVFIVVLFVVVGLTIANVIAILTEIKNLKQIIKELVDINKKLRDKDKKYAQEVPRIIRAIDLILSNVSNNKEQIGQLHKWLGMVLNISNLIPNESEGIDATYIIDELRERVKWAEEVEKRNVDEENYYKGG